MDDPDPAALFAAPKLCAVLSEGGASASGIVTRIVILFILILVNAFFAMSEIAVLSLNDTKISRMAESGDRRAARLVKLTANTSGFLSMIQIGVTLAGFLTSASAADYFVPIITGALSPYIKLPAGVLNTATLVLLTVVISYFSLVFGELVPKKIALQRSEKVSFLVSGLLLAFMRITSPFVKVLSASTNAVVRLLGIDPNADEERVSEEEIRMLVDAGEEKGVIEDSQAEMINNIFDFDDIDAGDIMTHRVDMVAVSEDMPLDEFISEAMSEGYSRIPVYREDQDDIVGIIYVKDLLKFVGKQMPEKKTVGSVMRKALFVPESKKCGALFKEMGEKRTQMAVVVDEYGGTAGIVTLEDILESIVGNIRDEYDNEDDEISRVDENTFYVDGTTDVEEIEELVGTDFSDNDCETIAGFVISRLGYLPVNGRHETVEYDGLRFTVLSMDDKRIDKLKIERLPRPESEKTEEN